MSEARIYAHDASAIKKVMEALADLTKYASDDYYVQAHTEEGVRLWHGDGYSPGVFVLEDDEWFFRPSYKESLS